jgi:hypothetical protein
MAELSEHIKNVCKIGQRHDCCRYLAVGAEGFECLKGTSLQVTLDTRVYNNTMVAQGDNCEGKTIKELNIK